MIIFIHHKHGTLSFHDSVKTIVLMSIMLKKGSRVCSFVLSKNAIMST